LDWSCHNRLGVSDEHKIAVFRIFQEAMTNVARHASAKNVLITLDREHSEVILTIHDDGVGFATESLEQTQSLGVLGMRERALLLSAQFLLESEIGHPSHACPRCGAG
jgi:signal transduction histidine kinase